MVGEAGERVVHLRDTLTRRRPPRLNVPRAYLGRLWPDLDFGQCSEIAWTARIDHTHTWCLLGDAERACVSPLAGLRRRQQVRARLKGKKVLSVRRKEDARERARRRRIFNGISNEMPNGIFNGIYDGIFNGISNGTYSGTTAPASRDGVEPVAAVRGLP